MHAWEIGEEHPCRDIVAITLSAQLNVQRHNTEKCQADKSGSIKRNELMDNMRFVVGMIVRA
jgi:hypothetical protein